MMLKSIELGLEDLKPCYQYLVHTVKNNWLRCWTDSKLNLFIIFSHNPVLYKDIKKIYELNELKESTLWRVKLTWTHNGRLGKQDIIVQADDAIKALRKAWATEDDKDLRTIYIEWLTPTECILI